MAAQPDRGPGNPAGLFGDIPGAPFDAGALGVTVLTRNVKDCFKNPGVAFENWLTSAAP